MVTFSLSSDRRPRSIAVVVVFTVLVHGGTEHSSLEHIASAQEIT